MAGFDQDGYVVLREAVPAATLAAYGQERAAARDGLLARRPGGDQVELAAQVPDDEPAGTIDPYAIVDAARALLLSPALVAVLTGAYDGVAPLLFDATETPASAPDGEHAYRDATFTALAERPDMLVTAAVALGPDDATFTFHPSSQRLATAPFSGRHRAFNPERDGDAALQRHQDELAAGLGATDTIILAPGDAVAWTADLVHLPLGGPALVAHYCPATVRPGWFAYRPERARHAAAGEGAAWLTTQHYDLVDAIALPDAPAPSAAEDAQEFERVEDALREHDADLATEPQPGAPAPESAGDDPQAAESRRQRGLVDSVRGLLGRRGGRRR